MSVIDEASPPLGGTTNSHLVSSPVSPYKRLMGKGSFQQYLREEGNILAAKYPFLTKHQIKKKAAQLWSRLSDMEKQNYTCIAPSLFKVRTPRKKSLGTRLREFRSPGKFLKHKQSASNKTGHATLNPSRYTTAKDENDTDSLCGQTKDELHPSSDAPTPWHSTSPIKTQALSVGNAAQPNSPEPAVSAVAASSPPLPTRPGSPELKQPQKRPLLSRTYSGGVKWPKSGYYKTPEIIEDVPGAVAQTGILKRTQEEGRKPGARVSFSAKDDAIPSPVNLKDSQSPDLPWITEYERKLQMCSPSPSPSLSKSPSPSTSPAGGTAGDSGDSDVEKDFLLACLHSDTMVTRSRARSKVNSTPTKQKKKKNEISYGKKATKKRCASKKSPTSRGKKAKLSRNDGNPDTQNATKECNYDFDDSQESQTFVSPINPTSAEVRSHPSSRRVDSPRTADSKHPEPMARKWQKSPRTGADKDRGLSVEPSAHFGKSTAAESDDQDVTEMASKAWKSSTRSPKAQSQKEDLKTTDCRKKGLLRERQPQRTLTQTKRPTTPKILTKRKQCLEFLGETGSLELKENESQNFDCAKTTAVDNRPLNRKKTPKQNGCKLQTKRWFSSRKKSPTQPCFCCSSTQTKPKSNKAANVNNKHPVVNGAAHDSNMKGDGDDTSESTTDVVSKPRRFFQERMKRKQGSSGKNDETKSGSLHGKKSQETPPSRHPSEVYQLDIDSSSSQSSIEKRLLRGSSTGRQSSNPKPKSQKYKPSVMHHRQTQKLKKATTKKHFKGSEKVPKKANLVPKTTQVKQIQLEPLVREEGTDFCMAATSLSNDERGYSEESNDSSPLVRKKSLQASTALEEALQGMRNIISLSPDNKWPKARGSFMLTGSPHPQSDSISSQSSVSDLDSPILPPSIDIPKLFNFGNFSRQLSDEEDAQLPASFEVCAEIHRDASPSATDDDHYEQDETSNDAEENMEEEEGEGEEEEEGEEEDGEAKDQDEGEEEEDEEVEGNEGEENDDDEEEEEKTTMDQLSKMIQQVMHRNTKQTYLRSKEKDPASDESCNKAKPVQRKNLKTYQKPTNKNQNANPRIHIIEGVTPLNAPVDNRGVRKATKLLQSENQQGNRQHFQQEKPRIRKKVRKPQGKPQPLQEGQLWTVVGETTKPVTVPPRELARSQRAQTLMESRQNCSDGILCDFFDIVPSSQQMAPPARLPTRAYSESEGSSQFDAFLK